MSFRSACAALVLSAVALSPAHAQSNGATPEMCTVILSNTFSMMEGEKERQLILMFQAYYAARARGSDTSSSAMMTTLGKGAKAIEAFNNEQLAAQTGNCMSGQAKEDVQVLFMLNESMKEDEKK